MEHTLQPDKGLKGGSCNVTACQKPYSALYYNKSTRKYYCEKCAKAINEANWQDCKRLYGVYELCELDDELINFDEISACEEQECSPYEGRPTPQRTYSGPPIKGKKGRDKRW